MPKLYPTLEAYKARNVDHVASTSPNARAKWWKPGWFWTGQILEEKDGSAQPQTSWMGSEAEAKRAVEKLGWVPLHAVPAEVIDLLKNFYSGDRKMPAIYTEGIKEWEAARKAEKAQQAAQQQQQAK